MRVSTVILPIYGRGEGNEVWRRAEALGFHAAYTYDHLTWQSFRDRAWFGAIPTLAAAATVTERMRIGTLVTSPNFRHPVTLAKELLSLDHLSDGRLVAGIGAGGTGFDATALGQQPWTPLERADRLEEFIGLLDELLTHPSTSVRGPPLLGRRGSDRSRVRATAPGAVPDRRHRTARAGSDGGVRTGLGHLR